MYEPHLITIGMMVSFLCALRFYFVFMIQFLCISGILGLFRSFYIKNVYFITLFIHFPKFGSNDANVVKYYCQAWLQWMATNKQSNSSLGFDSKECLFLLIYCRSRKCLSLFWFYSLQLSVLLFNVHFSKYWTWKKKERDFSLSGGSND